MFTAKKIALVSVINDLATDSRVQKTAYTLLECGYDVTLIGRKLNHSPALPEWPFKSVRMLLLFTGGPAFYFFFNLRLFCRLLFSKSHLLFANDLDTLLPNYLVSKIKKIPLIYDSHELFCEVPELQNAPLKKRIWEKLEQMIVPRLKNCVTVNQSIAEIFTKKYKVGFSVVRNIPSLTEWGDKKTKTELGLPEDKRIILLQGAGINIDRGAEELIEAMQYLDNCYLLIIGGGDVWPILKKKIKEISQNNVLLIDRVPKKKLLEYTQAADLGVSIDKNTNLNYYYSLPNKLFDYIQAGVPVLATRLPEIEKIVSTYRVGDFIKDHSPASIAAKINEMTDPTWLAEYKNNALKARESLSWEEEKKNLIRIIRSAKT